MQVLKDDTLRAIAQRVYGNNCLWYAIAAANAVTDATLVAGTTLKVPSIKTTANDASTFKPYDPNAIQGSTTPGLPYITPPPKQHCSALAKVLMVVVAVVVTVLTAGAAAPGAASASGGLWATGVSVLGGGYGAAGVAYAAIGGFAGSVASQAVGSAMGVTSFSWKNAFVSAATAAAGAGLGSLISSGSEAAAKALEAGKALSAGQKVAQFLSKQSWARAAASSIVGDLASYAANKALGNEASFSWKSIAANAVAAAVTREIGIKLHLDQPPTGVGGSGDFWKDLANNAIGGVVSLHTRRAFGFDEPINYGNIAADAFGNALGNAVASQIGSESQTTNGDDYRARDIGFYPDTESATVKLPTDNADGLDISTERGLATYIDNIWASNAGAPLIADNTNAPNAVRNAMEGPDVMDEAGRTIDWGNVRISINGYELPPFNEIRQTFYSIRRWASSGLNGFSDGVKDLFINAGTWIGTQAAKASLGEQTALDQMSMFMLDEMLTATTKGFDKTQTWKFIHDSELTLSYFAEHPDQLIYAMGEKAEAWWNSRTPEQRAYSIGHFAGETAALYGVGKIGQSVLEAPSMIRGLTASMPAARRGLVFALTDSLVDAHLAGKNTNLIADQIATIFTRKSAGQNAGKVILGRFDGAEYTTSTGAKAFVGGAEQVSGYQQIARNGGGIWYETDAGFYERIKANLIARGASPKDAADIAFLPNERFLLQQARAGVSEFKFVNISPKMTEIRYPTSATFREMRFLSSPAFQAMGFKRQGSSWIRLIPPSPPGR